MLLLFVSRCKGIVLKNIGFDIGECCGRLRFIQRPGKLRPLGYFIPTPPLFLLQMMLVVVGVEGSRFEVLCPKPVRGGFYVKPAWALSATSRTPDSSRSEQTSGATGFRACYELP